MAGSAAQPAAPPPQVAALEMGYWSDFGGETDLSRVRDDVGKMLSITKAADSARGEHLVQDYLDLGPLCADIAADSGESREYFVPPDSQARTLWSAFVNLAWDGGRGCEAAVNLLRAGETRSFLAEMRNSLPRLAAANSYREKIEARISAVEEAGALAASGHYTAHPGPLGILPLPPGSTPFPSIDTGRPVSRDAFVRAYYGKSLWAYEENLIARGGFVSGAIEAWDTVGGSQEWITIARFSSANDASSWFDHHHDDFRPTSQPATEVTDPADGGIGWTVPTTSDQELTAVWMETHIGSDVITVTDYTPVTPNPAEAKALLLKQYDSLKKSA